MGRPAAPIGAEKLDPSGYRRRRVPPDHPLATGRDHWPRVHRIVAYEVHGPGPHRCERRELCDGAEELTWDQIDVDHLDFDRQNNHPSNLILSCRRCNRQRWENGPASRVVSGVRKDDHTV